MKKTIRVHTNVVFDGWSAGDLETGVGGSEEKLIEWARELSEYYDITIYHNGIHGVFDGVKYVDFREFKPWEYSGIFISFKTKQLLLQSINAGKIYHWTSDIENWGTYKVQNLDRIFCISDYQKGKMKPQDLPLKRLYLWADIGRLNKNKVKKIKGTMLYCTSYDRGLEDLLRNWKVVKKELKLKKLIITYGWDSMDKVIKGNPGMRQWKIEMKKLMKQEGIEVVGRLSNDDMCKEYWKAEYWCLPSNAPDNELFCLSAIKAEYCRCKPVIRRIGGLQESVLDCYDFDKIIGQKAAMHTFKKGSLGRNRKYVVDNFSMKSQIKKWREILDK